MKKTLLALPCLFASFLSYAFSVAPMTAEIQPFGSKSQTIFKLENTSSQPLRVESASSLISFDKEGKEVNTETDDLLVLPFNATIPAHSSQSFVVRYIGEPMPSKAQSYRVAFETVQLEDENKKGIKMNYRFLTRVDLQPKQ